MKSLTRNHSLIPLALAGLTGTQAETFAFLLEWGESRASEVAKGTRRPRGVAYKALEELMNLGLATKSEKKNGVTLFAPEHPVALETLFENREKQMKRDRERFLASFPELVSLYHLSTRKPGVTYFEGEEGIERILDDGLTSKTEIYMYGDPETSMRHASEINERYGVKRKKLGIKKKIIVPDTTFAREYLRNYNTDITEVRFVPQEFFKTPTSSTLEIYDGKLSYVTIDEQKKIGVLLRDPNMFLLHKQLFEFAWSCAKPMHEK